VLDFQRLNAKAQHLCERDVGEELSFEIGVGGNLAALPAEEDIRLVFFVDAQEKTLECGISPVGQSFGVHAQGANFHDEYPFETG
jgi:hypothetical protein